MLQQTHDSECHCCLIVKYLSQLHKQVISPVPLVPFNWYYERREENDEALSWGRDFINLVCPKNVYRRYLLIFLSCPPHSFSRTLFACRCFLKERKEKYNNICLQAIKIFLIEISKVI